MNILNELIKNIPASARIVLGTAGFLMATFGFLNVIVGCIYRFIARDNNDFPALPKIEVKIMRNLVVLGIGCLLFNIFRNDVSVILFGDAAI